MVNIHYANPVHGLLFIRLDMHETNVMLKHVAHWKYDLYTVLSLSSTFHPCMSIQTHDTPHIYIVNNLYIFKLVSSSYNYNNRFV